MNLAPPSDETLFAAALERPPAERAAYLDTACAGDAARRARIEGLLRAHASAEQSFMATATSAVPGTVVPAAGQMIGRYKLLQKLGEGGCGTVYMAEQEEPVRRRVALKVIKLGMDTKEVIARFSAEQQALALMDHPNIARVFDAGATESGRSFFVMELVRGVPITKFCDEKDLPTAARLELFTQVCHAVQHAHQKGIIHRDLKPSNILVTLHDGVPVPKVIDFGIAKATQGRLTDATLFTAFEQFIGTPAYMSPEQAEMSGLDIDTRSDIYSLGVLLYELLTGRPPFDPKTLVEGGLDEIRRIIREVDPPRMSTRLSTLSDHDRATIARQRGVVPAQLSTLLRGDLDWIVMRCLEKDRTRRYETANGLAMDLARHRRHEPVTARPPRPSYVLAKLVRRHRFGFAAGTAIAATVVLGGISSTWQAVRATRAEREQTRLRAAAQMAQAVAETDALRSRRRAYAADMNLAQRALAMDNLGHAETLLNRYRPKSGEQDVRGWEWRYLWQQCQSDAELVLCQKRRQIGVLSVSADGNWLAIKESSEGFGGGINTNGELSVMNLRTRVETPVPGSEGSSYVAFSPREPLLAIAVASGFASAPGKLEVLLWDIMSRQVVRKFSIPGICLALYFSADGDTLAIKTYSGISEIGLWRVADGKQVRSINAAAGDGTFAVDRNLTFAVNAAGAGRIEVIDLKTGVERWTSKAADERIVSLAVSPDGKSLASAGGFAESTIRIWDSETGLEIGRLEGHRSYVSALLFGPDGKTLISASGDQTIRIWDVNTRKALRTLRGHKLEIWSLALLPDNTTLVSGCKDGSVYLWNAMKLQPARGSPTLLTGIAKWRFAADSTSIITVSERATLARWHGRHFAEKNTLMNLSEFSEPNERGSFCIAHDAPLVAIGVGGLVRVLNWELQKMVHERETMGHRVTIPEAFLERGTKLITSDYGRMEESVSEWNLASGESRRVWQGPASAFGFQCSVSPDGQQCAILAYRRGDFFVNLRTGRQTQQNLQLRQLGPSNFSPDGGLFVAPSMLGYARIWHTGTWQEVATLSGFMQGVHSAVFSPDGRRLVTGSGGIETIRLWDMESQEALLTLEGQGSVFRSSEFSPDGNVLGSMNLAGNLLVWRAPSWGEIDAAEKALGTR